MADDVPSGRSVVVTGASKGIGRACALRLHEHGWRVFAGVRREEDAAALRAEASDRLMPLILDITREDHIRDAAAAVTDATGDAGLDGLVNNAGIAVAAPLEFLPIAALRRQLEVNVIGQIAVTRALLPALRRARGRIVMMGSVAGRSALPFMGPYAASKFALEAIADALRVELMPWGMHVVLVEPGTVDTPIWNTSIDAADAMLEDMPPELGTYYGRELDGLRRSVRRFAEENVGLRPEAVARVVEEALVVSRPKTRYLMGRGAKLRVLLEHLPDRMRDALIRNRMKKL